MPKKMLIDATHAEETRVVVVDGNKVEEFDFESENKRQLAGNIYLAKVTRVEPSLQAAFVDYGGNRHGFLAFSEVHPDYYQIPVADREALLAEEAAYAKQQAEDDAQEKPKSRGRRRSRKPVAEKAAKDATVSQDVSAESASGMDVVDVPDDENNNDPIIGFDTAGTTEPAPGENGDTGHDVPADAPLADENADTEAPSEEDDTENVAKNASSKDDSIESVAQEDEAEDIRPRRKPRPRRYKIQEVIKVRQILLIQVVKEERGNKGAALTTYLSLAGRYCVLMPNTARGGGISRKITNAADRKKLKEIAGEIEVPQGAGLIVRTAGAKRTKAEIKRDYDYLLRQWEEVRDLTLKSIAPAQIYEEGSLIKRSIRDLYNRDIDEVLIEGEAGHKMAKDYMKMLTPSHAKNVKLYTDPLPLFARFQVESYLAGMFNPTVQLKSGGYIVIGVTEALVAIDVNSGRATKESSIEDTATKTNLEAADEVARQLRLRDLAGLIVIDFIDMEDRRNNTAVEKRIKDRLKTDRARIQVGRISGFGLMEMSRQRLRPGMIEATTAPCPHCHGTGLTRSDDNLALSILRELEEEGVRRRSREVLVSAPVAIANYMLNQKREHVAMIEQRNGLSIRIESNPMLISPEYTIERFKTATRAIASTGEVVSMETSLVEPETVDDVHEPDDNEDRPPRKKRRRRRRRGGKGQSENPVQTADTPETGARAEAKSGDDDGEMDAAKSPEVAEISAVAKPEAEAAPAKKPTSRRTTRKKKEPEPLVQTDDKDEAGATETVAETPPAPKQPAKRTRKKAEPKDAADAPVEPAVKTPAKSAAVEVPEAAPELAMASAAPAAPKPKRKGWWSRG